MLNDLMSGLFFIESTNKMNYCAANEVICSAGATSTEIDL
jgi:hypothetical protein